MTYFMNLWCLNMPRVGLCPGLPYTYSLTHTAYSSKQRIMVQLNTGQWKSVCPFLISSIIVYLSHWMVSDFSQIVLLDKGATKHFFFTYHLLNKCNVISGKWHPWKWHLWPICKVIYPLVSQSADSARPGLSVGSPFESKPCSYRTLASMYDFVIFY